MPNNSSLESKTNTTTSNAKKYARIRYRLLIVDLISWLVFLMAMYSSGLSSTLASFSSGVSSIFYISLAIYLIALSAIYYFLMLPVHVYGGYILEHRFDLSRLTPFGWIKKEVKQIALSALCGIILIEGLYLLLKLAPNSWPILATLGYVGFSVVLARIFPTLLLPLFYKTVPLKDKSLAEKLLGLCKRAGLPALGVFRFGLGAETRKANAALAGLGKSRRVLLADTLIENFTPDEIEGVLAHEVGHSRYHHIAKLLTISAVGSFFAFFLIDTASAWWVEQFGLSGISDIAGFPILILWLSVLGLIGMPFQNVISRFFERQSDNFALTTAKPDAFAGALKRLALLNLADPNPPKWVVWMFYDHPPITGRIQKANSAAIPPGSYLKK